MPAGSSRTKHLLDDGVTSPESNTHMATPKCTPHLIQVVVGTRVNGLLLPGSQADMAGISFRVSVLPIPHHKCVGSHRSQDLWIELTLTLVQGFISFTAKLMLF